MVRLYKALMKTGATVEITPVESTKCVIFTFKYKGEKHISTYDLELVDSDRELIYDMLCVELAKFVKYVNAHDA